MRVGTPSTLKIGDKYGGGCHPVSKKNQHIMVSDGTDKYSMI